MILKSIIFVLCVSSLSVSCGPNKDTESADKKRLEAQQENKILKEEIAALENLLQNVFTTETNVWVPTKFLIGYTVADTSCADIGYTLPTSIQFMEFKKEIYDANDSWQSVSIERFHQKDLTQQLENGLAICRRDLKSDSPINSN